MTHKETCDFFPTTLGWVGLVTPGNKEEMFPPRDTVKVTLNCKQQLFVHPFWILSDHRSGAQWRGWKSCWQESIPFVITSRQVFYITGTEGSMLGTQMIPWGISWCPSPIFNSAWIWVVKNPPVNAGDTKDIGIIPESERCPGGGNGNPLQYSCLENAMDREAWRATVHGWQRVRHDYACVHWAYNKLVIKGSIHSWMRVLVTSSSKQPGPAGRWRESRMNARGKRCWTSDAGSAGAEWAAVCPTHFPFRGFHTETEINQNPAYLTYMQSTSCKMQGWRKHRLKSRFLGEISIISEMQMIPPYGRSKEELKSLLMKVKEEN